MAKHETDQEFVSLYLERERQGSNIYFEEGVTLYYEVLPGRVSRRAPFAFARWAWGAAFSAALLLMLAFGWSMLAPLSAPLAAAQAVLDDIVAGQQALLALSFDEAALRFSAAERNIAEAQRTDVFSQAALFVFSLVSLGGAPPAAEFAAWKTDFLAAADAMGRAAEPLFRLSRAPLVRMEEASQPPRGVLLSESVRMMKEGEARLTASLERLSRAAEEGVTPDEQEQLSVLFPRLSLARANTERLRERFELAAWALGAEQPRRFLLVVQDTSVPRATGGLIGSYALLETAGGAITKFALDDVYNLDGELTVNIVPPRPLQKVSTAWGVHNANWFFDFPTSAQKLAYLFKQAGGGEVDGVIAVNERFLKHLLEVAGPVAAPHHEGVIVSAFNVSELAAARTELEFAQKADGKPLAVLSDVLWALAGSVPELSPEQARASRAAILAGITGKDVLMWLRDADFQRRIESQGWAGAVVDDDHADYLAVVTSDIGSDGRAAHRLRVLKETRVLQNGEVESTVVVQFAEDPAYQGRALSRYVRVYVPEGSRLREASGASGQAIVPHIDYRRERFVEDDDLVLSQASLRTDEQSHTDVFVESGKTVFAGWVAENGGSIIYTYTLPFRASVPGELSFVFQKQPGARTDLQFKLVAPEGREIVPDASGTGAEFSGELVSDKLFTVSIR